MMKRFLASVILLFCLVAPCLAQQPLKLSTATTINIGPFIDDTDFTTPETALTVTGMTVKIIKQSDTFSSTVTSFAPTASGGSNDSQHVASAMYNLELTAANTDTVGRLEVVTTVAGALPVFHRFLVVPTTQWDTAVATGPASILDLLGQACSGVTVAGSWGKLICDNLTGPVVRYLVAGTSDSGTTTTVVDTERTEAATDHWVPGLIVFTSGNISGQSRYITGFNASTDTLTFTPAVSQAVTTETYEIRAIPASLASELATVQADTDDLQSKLGTPAGASLSADVAAVKVDSAAIKTKTDFLPSVTAGANGGVFIAGVNAATTITTGLTTTFTGNLTGSAASVTGAVGSVTGAVGSVTGNVGGNVTGNVTGTLGGLTAAALKDFFDTDTTTTYASAVAGSVVKEVVDNAGGSLLTNASIADAVWDEATGGHVAAGSTGKALTDAASAGDPWTTALPGAYGAGTAGKIVGDNLNGTITSRASQTTLDTLQADADDIQTRLPASLIGGRVDSYVGSMGANVLTAAAINSDAFTAAKFASDASTEFAATLMATTFEGANTFKHFLQYGASALFGKYNSASGTFNFRDIADSKNRIIYTTSSTARTAITLNPD